MSKLKEVVSNLKEGSDIEGALMDEGKDAIIAYDVPENTNYEVELPKIMELIEKGNGFALTGHRKGLFV